MYRLRLLKYITQTGVSDQLILRRNIKCSYLNQCSCISITKYSEAFEKPTLTSKYKHEEETGVDFQRKSALSEKEFLVRMKNDPDTFGSPIGEVVLDEGDLREKRYLSEQPMPSHRLREKQYADIIKDLIKKRKIKEAIDVVELRMLKEDRVKPGCYIYNLLLGACGRIGYTKKAFMLFNQLKKRGLTPTGGTYTALFNACANSPWPTTDGITRATYLRNLMIEKGYEPNDTNYNAMIKAFGRCGDVPTAFALVDEMFSKRFVIKDDTINFLLQACITDREAGFRHSLLVWRKMKEKKIEPSLYTYNLMLRSIRDCGLGDVEVTQDVINRLLPGSSNSKNNEMTNNRLESTQLLAPPCTPSTFKASEKEDINKTYLDVANSKMKEQITECSSLTINESQDCTDKYESCSENHENNIVATINENPVNTTKYEIKSPMPNLMADIPHLGNIIHLSEITTPDQRLLLVGGANGFLENMTQHKCSPDIKTFTQLLDSIPSTLAAEKELFTMMKRYKVKPDVDFYNMLIKKRSMRFDYENAKVVLWDMQQQNLRPDLITYGVLALGCKTKGEALELIETMKQGSYSLNSEILGAMVHQACHRSNYLYVLEIMETCLRENIQTNKKFMDCLANFKRKEYDRAHAKELTKSEAKLFGIFRTRYKTWLQEVQVDETEDAHPWQQYRQTNEGGEKYQSKDTARFQPRRLSRFKVKTSLKYKNQ